MQREVEHETAARVVGSQGGAPIWLVPLLALVLVALTLYVILALQPPAIQLIVLVVILVVVVGAILALNPRRSSPVGGTRRR
jgi:hypothetical protein